MMTFNDITHSLTHSQSQWFNINLVNVLNYKLDDIKCPANRRVILCYDIICSHIQTQWVSVALVGCRFIAIHIEFAIPEQTKQDE